MDKKRSSRPASLGEADKAEKSTDSDFATTPASEQLEALQDQFEATRDQLVRAKKKAGRPPTGIRRPVIALRVHEDVYAAVARAAEEKKISISEEAAKRIGKTVRMDRDKLTQEAMMKSGADAFLVSSGYTKVRDQEGNELWAKGVAVSKYMALSPEFEAAIESAVLRALKKARE